MEERRHVVVFTDKSCWPDKVNNPTAARSLRSDALSKSRFRRQHWTRSFVIVAAVVCKRLSTSVGEVSIKKDIYTIVFLKHIFPPEYVNLKMNFVD